MSRVLRIAPNLSLPLDAVTQTFALLAVRGAGKSNAGAAMAEEMFKAELPFVAIDPVGSWHGLRSGADGRASGGLAIPIFGGRNGDVPLERGSGQLVADLIVDKRLSCVVDLSNFASEGDKKAFLLAFAQRLYQKNQDPLHLFLEEADDYIPQRPMRDEAQLLRAWENIVRRGRARGLGMTMITQRSAAVAKMVLTQVETLFVLRTTGPQDIAAIQAWVKYHQVDEELLGSLSSLEDGEAWVWSPHYLKTTERIRFRKRETFDSGATPKNLRAKDAKRVATLADVDLGVIRAQMSAAIERQKADDPTELRRLFAELKAKYDAREKRLAEIERELAAKAGKAPREPKVKKVEVPVISKGQVVLIKRLENLLARSAEDIHKLAESAAKLNGARAELMRPPAPRHVATPATGAPLKVSQSKLAKTQPLLTNETKLGKGERATMIAIAQHPSGVTREQLTVLTGYKRSTRDAYLQRLRTAGFVDDSLAPTDSGIAWLGPDYEPLPTGDALREHWLRNLPEGERRVLEIASESYPESVSREDISKITEYARSSRDAYIQRLSARKLVLASRGAVAASKELFG